MAELHVVTGAFGYSGRAIARRLLEAGVRVRTLTNSPNRRRLFGNEHEKEIEVSRFHFDNVPRLVEALRGAATLYNTYWVRFNQRGFSFDQAVKNTEVLFAAAASAKVARIVHVSITNPTVDSPLAYFRGKAKIERALVSSGVSHAILRPAVLFGGAGILVNNIAWALRRLPVFGVFGDGEYRIRPIHVDDLARLAVAQGLTQGHGHRNVNCVVQAVGPETYTFRELVKTIGHSIGCERPIVSVPPFVGHLAAVALGQLLRDVVLTRDEIKGLMAGLLYVDAPPAGNTRLSEWARQHADRLGRRYASELARRVNRTKAYAEL